MTLVELQNVLGKQIEDITDERIPFANRIKMAEKGVERSKRHFGIHHQGIYQCQRSAAHSSGRGKYQNSLTGGDSMSVVTQRQKIVKYCTDNGSITIREAFGLNINSPSKRISEIRHSGLFDVCEEKETRINSDGERVRYNRYFITERAANNGRCQMDKDYN